MTVSDVKETLRNENELLSALIKFINDYDEHRFTGSGRFIKASWKRFLDERRETNDDLIDQNGSEIKRDLLEEMEQVKKYIQFTNRRGYRERWFEFLDCERDILKRLIDKLED